MCQHRAWLAAALLLVATPLLVSGARQCLTTIESSSPMFGAHWKKSFVTYSQESQWKRHGDMVKLNIFYDSDKGCVVGVKPTYGSSNSLSARLGTEKTADKVPVSTKHIQLGAKEKIISTHWKASKCVEYFKVSTNHGRFLEIGNKESTAPLKTNKPATGAFLGFFKGFTDVVNSNAATGSLQQLQLFWVLRECEEPSKGSIVTEAGPGGESSMNIAEDGSVVTNTAPISQEVQGSSPDDPTAGRGSSGSETVIVIDEQTGDALAVGVPQKDVDSGVQLGNTAAGSIKYGGDSSSSSSSSSSDAAANATESQPGFTNSDTALNIHGNGSDTDGGIKLPFGLGKKYKAKSKLQKLKNDLLWGLNGTVGGANCSLQDHCPSGSCLTPSCLLNGVGKEVLTMMCYGTNIVPNPILDHTVGNPCMNLACQLHYPNCTSGPLGLGGFCTGKVVRMGTTAKLHPGGAIWEGFPCVEHKGPLLALLPKMPHKLFRNISGDYNANGAYVSKAWKVCDCINGAGLKAGSLAMQLPDHVQEKLNMTAQIISAFLETRVDKLRLSPIVEKITELVDGVTEALSMFEASLSIPVKDSSILGLSSMLPSLEVSVTELPVMQQGVLDMSLPQVLAQWATAFAAKAQLTKAVISQSKLNALRAFVPGFEVPSVLVANVSTPLLKPTVDVNLPIYTIPDESLESVTLLLPNITSLPLLCIPKAMAMNKFFNASGFNKLDIHNMTMPSMARVVEHLLSVFPHNEWAASVVSGKFADVASKWTSGVLLDEKIPVLNVTKKQWNGLSSILPSVSNYQPTLVLWNASSLLFTKPRFTDKKLATLVVPAELSEKVASIVSALVPGLPAVLMPAGLKNISKPVLRLSAVTPADLKLTIDSLVSSIHGHPAFNITMPSGGILNFTLPIAKFGAMPGMSGLDGMLPGGFGNVLEAFAGFDAMKKNLTGLAGMKNMSGDFADQAFIKLMGHNFTGIKLIPGNLSGFADHLAAKGAKKEEGLAALKSLLGPKVAVMKAAKKQKAKILNITLSQ